MKSNPNESNPTNHHDSKELDFLSWTDVANWYETFLLLSFLFNLETEQPMALLVLSGNLYKDGNIFYCNVK